ncbi:methyltransferase [Salmonella enterica subsp. enterica]|uniref:Methyltransferase n=1 Tax=Salmonella enterica I TaxID=59201 RepID=A0A447TT89_SALET|nr:methyltransferase [Salmonella enterica subsp. enterica]
MDETGATDGALSVLAARWGLEHDEDNPMALVLTPQHLELRKRDEPKLGGIFVDFVGGAMAHRRKFRRRARRSGGESRRYQRRLPAGCG